MAYNNSSYPYNSYDQYRHSPQPGYGLDHARVQGQGQSPGPPASSFGHAAGPPGVPVSGLGLAPISTPQPYGHYSLPQSAYPPPPSPGPTHSQGRYRPQNPLEQGPSRAPSPGGYYRAFSPAPSSAGPGPGPGQGQGPGQGGNYGPPANFSYPPPAPPQAPPPGPPAQDRFAYPVSPQPRPLTGAFTYDQSAYRSPLPYQPQPSPGPQVHRSRSPAPPHQQNYPSPPRGSSRAIAQAFQAPSPPPAAYPITPPYSSGPGSFQTPSQASIPSFPVSPVHSAEPFQQPAYAAPQASHAPHPARLGFSNGYQQHSPQPPQGYFQQPPQPQLHPAQPHPPHQPQRRPTSSFDRDFQPFPRRPHSYHSPVPPSTYALPVQQQQPQPPQPAPPPAPVPYTVVRPSTCSHSAEFTVPLLEGTLWRAVQAKVTDLLVRNGFPATHCLISCTTAPGGEMSILALHVLPAWKWELNAAVLEIVRGVVG